MSVIIPPPIYTEEVTYGADNIKNAIPIPQSTEDWMYRYDAIYVNNYDTNIYEVTESGKPIMVYVYGKAGSYSSWGIRVKNSSDKKILVYGSATVADSLFERLDSLSTDRYACIISDTVEIGATGNIGTVSSNSSYSKYIVNANIVIFFQEN